MSDHSRGHAQDERMIARLDLVTVHDYSSDMSLIPTNTVQSFSCRNDFLFQPRLLTKSIIEFRGNKSILMCENEKLLLRICCRPNDCRCGCPRWWRTGRSLQGVSPDRSAMIAWRCSRCCQYYQKLTGSAGELA